MRKSNQQSIGEVLKEYLKQNKLGAKLHQAEIINNWESIVGKLFARHTKGMFFSEGKLFIELDSPSVRNELLMQRSVIIEKINTLAGEQLVTDLVLK